MATNDEVGALAEPSGETTLGSVLAVALATETDERGGEFGLSFRVAIAEAIELNSKVAALGRLLPRFDEESSAAEIDERGMVIKASVSEAREVLLRVIMR